MLYKEEVKKLAKLARIDISEEEVEKLRGDMNAILGYVKSIQEFHSDEARSKDEEGSGLINVMREDLNPKESGAYSSDIISEFPDKEGDYLKVKKIL